MQLTFNRQLDPVFTDVELYDSSAAKTVAVTVSVDATGKILTIVPAGGTALAPYHSYTLAVHALATNGASLDVVRPFTADVPASLLPAVTGLTVTPASADYDTATFTLSWAASPSATGYQVWARDTDRNPSYLLLKTLPSAPAPGTSVTLPATFDWYPDDGRLTPLAFGVAVDLAVVAVNAAGDAPLPSSATPVRRSDTVAPWLLTLAQAGQADNSAGGTARTITVTATFDEYMDSGGPADHLPPGGPHLHVRVEREPDGRHVPRHHPGVDRRAGCVHHRGRSGHERERHDPEERLAHERDGARLERRVRERRPDGLRPRR